jgi:hypothetical protein
LPRVVCIVPSSHPVNPWEYLIFRLVADSLVIYSDQLGLAIVVDACQDIRLELAVIAGITIHLGFPSLLHSSNTLCGFANAYAYCFKLHRSFVIKQWSANGGTRTCGGTQSYLAIIFSFPNAIRNTETHHYFGRWLSISVWPFGLFCSEFYNTNLPWNYRLSGQVQYIVMASTTLNQAR